MTQTLQTELTRTHWDLKRVTFEIMWDGEIGILLLFGTILINILRKQISGCAIHIAQPLQHIYLLFHKT